MSAKEECFHDKPLLGMYMFQCISTQLDTQSTFHQCDHLKIYTNMCLKKGQNYKRLHFFPKKRDHHKDKPPPKFIECHVDFNFMEGWCQKKNGYA